MAERYSLLLELTLVAYRRDAGIQLMIELEQISQAGVSRPLGERRPSQEVYYGNAKNFDDLRSRLARAYCHRFSRSNERNELAGHNATNTDRAGPLLSASPSALWLVSP